MSIVDRNLGDYLFFASLAIFFSLTFAVNIQAVAVILLPLSYVALALLALAFIFRLRQYKAVEILVLCLFGAVSLYQFFVANDNSLMKLVLLLAAMKGISFERCVRFEYYLRIAWIVALIAASYLGLAEDIVTHDLERGVRHSMGFSNANQLGMAVLIACLEALYMRGFKVSPVSAVVILIVAFLLDAVSGSRASTVFVLLALLIAAINTAHPSIIKKSIIVRYACTWIAPTMFILTWTLLSAYQGGAHWAVQLNDYLTNRLWNISIYNDLFTPTLFGQNLASAGITLDTLYAYLVYGYGVVIAVTYLVTQPLLVNMLWKRGQQRLAIVLFLFATYGLFERLWVCVEYNALMLAYIYLLYGMTCGEASLGHPARRLGRA